MLEETVSSVMFFSRATTRSLICFVIIFDSCQALARCLSRSKRATFALIVSFTRARRPACKIEMSALLKDVPWVLNARNISRPSCACSLLLTLRKEVANCTAVYAHGIAQVLLITR